MQILKATAIALAILYAWGVEAQQTRRDIGGLIGAPVYALDGAEIGTIADVRIDEGGQLAAIRIEAGARLGFGARTVQLPGSAVSIVRGAAVVNLPKEAVEMLPTVDRNSSDESKEGR